MAVYCKCCICLTRLGHVNVITLVPAEPGHSNFVVFVGWQGSFKVILSHVQKFGESFNSTSKCRHFVMRRMSHYLGFYTEILSTKVGIKRSELIELITIVQLYDHLSPNW